MSAPLSLPGAASVAADPPDVVGQLLLLALALVAAAYLLGIRRYAGRVPSWPAGVRRFGTWRVVAFVGALATIGAALVPLDELADTRFSWHMTQHMLLVVVAAPLLAAGAPAVPLVLLLPVRWRPAMTRARLALRRAPLLRTLYLPVTAWVLQVAVLWGWHLPEAYQATLDSPVLHELEHVLLIGTAWMFWWHMLAAGRRRMTGISAVVYSFAATLPMAALGAVLTLAPRPAVSGGRRADRRRRCRSAHGPAARRPDHVGSPGRRLPRDDRGAVPAVVHPLQRAGRRPRRARGAARAARPTPARVDRAA